MRVLPPTLRRGSIPCTPLIKSRSSPPRRNRLLMALPPDDLVRLRPRLEAVELPLRQVLHAPGKPIGAVHFPETGSGSTLACMEDGDAGEVGQIGNEGMVGLPLLLGGDSDDLEAVVQSPGTALRLDAQAFHESLEQIPALQTLLLRYALVHHGQVARTAACNGRHPIDQRLARWLLMAHDRSEGDEFPMTHEFLSMMLGVRRGGGHHHGGQTLQSQQGLSASGSRRPSLRLAPRLHPVCRLRDPRRPQTVAVAAD